MHKPVSIIGYSGHAYVVCEILFAMGREISGYFDLVKKDKNPFHLSYLGSERNLAPQLKEKQSDFFVAIGDNRLRKEIQSQLENAWGEAVTIKHPMAYISPSAQIGPGSMVSANASITALAKIGAGVICNTGSTIEHECILENFVHIAPGATLCGNVHVGEGTLIGANAVVKPGISIGRFATIGSGAVIVKPVPDHTTIIGNPQRSL